MEDQYKLRPSHFEWVSPLKTYKMCVYVFEMKGCIPCITVNDNP